MIDWKVLGGLCLVATWCWAIFQIWDVISEVTRSWIDRLRGHTRLVGNEDLRDFLMATYGDGPWEFTWDDTTDSFKILNKPKEKDNDATNER